MSVTYTNRKGFPFYLCQGVTKTGKPRYFFAREIKGEPVEQIPAGYTITESVNGVVSLSKAPASQLREEEINAVQAAVARHPNHRRYRVNVRPKRIEIYEAVGADYTELIADFQPIVPLPPAPGTVDHPVARLERRQEFSAVLRFTLIAAEQRTFIAERMCYLGSIDDFIRIGDGPLEPMAADIIATLGAVLNLEVPQVVLESARLSAADLKTELAVAWYAQQRLSIGKAREWAGRSLWEFRQILASRRIAPHYEEDDRAEDVKTLRELGRL